MTTRESEAEMMGRGETGQAPGKVPALTAYPLRSLMIAWLVTICLSVCAMYLFGFHYCTTDSAGPIGFYREIAGTPERGDLVLVHLSAAQERLGVERGYIAPNEPLIKRIVGLPGDLVTVASGTVRPIDSHGRPLPHFPFGVYRLKVGEVWLIGDVNPRSWDSRYFGPGLKSGIVARVEPWGWR